jgi:hypothetical protein
MPTETIECPLCLGAGTLARAEILDRLGVKDFARVAQLSAEEAIRLLLSKHQQDEQSGWARFEGELAQLAKHEFLMLAPLVYAAGLRIR